MAIIRKSVYELAAIVFLCIKLRSYAAGKGYCDYHSEDCIIIRQLA